METMCRFTIEQLYHRILSAFSARQTKVKKLSEYQQEMEARDLAVTHIQTLKVVLYKTSSDMIKNSLKDKTIRH